MRRDVHAAGFTLIEVLLVMALVAVLSGFTVVNLIRPQNAATLDGLTGTLVADLKGQQIKSMAGDSISAASSQPHGVYVQSGSYTVFKGTTYAGGDGDNFVVNTDSGVTLSTTLPSTQVVFAEGTGAVTGFSGTQNTITVTNTNSGNTKTITLNRFGAITVN